MQRLLLAWDVARRNNENTTTQTSDNANKIKNLHPFQQGQIVLLEEHSFLHKNQKLVAKWSGPHQITQLKRLHNVEIQI